MLCAAQCCSGFLSFLTGQLLQVGDGLGLAIDHAVDLDHQLKRAVLSIDLDLLGGRRQARRGWCGVWARTSHHKRFPWALAVANSNTPTTAKRSSRLAPTALSRAETTLLFPPSMWTDDHDVCRCGQLPLLALPSWFRLRMWVRKMLSTLRRVELKRRSYA